MALVVIVLSDNEEDGTVDVSCNSEPGMPGPASDKEPTAAHIVALGMLESIKGDSAAA